MNEFHVLKNIFDFTNEQYIINQFEGPGIPNEQTVWTYLSDIPALQESLYNNYRRNRRSANISPISKMILHNIDSVDYHFK